jgi:hypothetical protein
MRALLDRLCEVLTLYLHLFYFLPGLFDILFFEDNWVCAVIREEADLSYRERFQIYIVGAQASVLGHVAVDLADVLVRGHTEACRFLVLTEDTLTPSLFELLVVLVPQCGDHTPWNLNDDFFQQVPMLKNDTCYVAKRREESCGLID